MSSRKLTRRELDAIEGSAYYLLDNDSDGDDDGDFFDGWT
jgi:hypothetical protein